MTGLYFVLLFISLYGVSLIGGRRGLSLYLSGLVLHGGYLLYRWSFLGRPPVTEKHDILLVMAFLVALSLLYFRRKVSGDLLFTAAPLFAVTFCLFAVFQERLDTIEPNMNSPWFYAHISFFTLGYSLFAIGSLAGVFALKEDGRLFETVQYRFILSGWLLFSFSLVAGSVWFYLSYGVYWLWTAKEIWITISWLYYSFYLHARLIRSLSGRPASLLGTAGLAVMLFAYLGVTPILGSPWSQF